MVIYIECKIAPGAFSGELVFRIENGIQHQGLAPRRYFFTSELKQIGADNVLEGTRAYIAGRIINENEDGSMLVSIPDGEVICVNRDKVKPCEPANVPVRPRPALGH